MPLKKQRSVLKGGSATIIYDADKTNVEALKNIVTETGYTPAD